MPIVRFEFTNRTAPGVVGVTVVDVPFLPRVGEGVELQPGDASVTVQSVDHLLDPSQWKGAVALVRLR